VFGRLGGLVFSFSVLRHSHPCGVLLVVVPVLVVIVVVVVVVVVVVIVVIAVVFRIGTGSGHL
jgi:hypothetical protein